MISSLSGAWRMCAMRCGRLGMESPLQFIVPGSRQIRAALWTVRSIFTSAEDAAAMDATHFCTRASSCVGSWMRYINCAPLPESIIKGSAQPRVARPARTSSAFATAASCSLSEEDTPEGRSASQSIKSHLRQITSASVVVGFFPAGRMRFTARASRSGLTGLTVT